MNSQKAVTVNGSLLSWEVVTSGVTGIGARAPRNLNGRIQCSLSKCIDDAKLMIRSVGCEEDVERLQDM